LYYNFADLYAEAVKEMNIHQIEDMSDPSDAEKWKRSWNKRWKKVSTDFITEYPTSKKYKKDIPISFDESNTDTDDATESNFMIKRYSSLMTPPPTLNIQQKKAASSLIKSVETRKSS